jgi:hypothetical protein
MMVYFNAEKINGDTYGTNTDWGISEYREDVYRQELLREHQPYLYLRDQERGDHQRAKGAGRGMIFLLNKCGP